MVEKIVAKHVAAFAPIAAHVECADVSALLANVVNVIMLDDVFVAAEQNAVVWAVVYQVVLDALAYAKHVNTWLIAAGPLAHVMYVVVGGAMPTRPERLAVSAR